MVYLWVGPTVPGEASGSPAPSAAIALGATGAAGLAAVSATVMETTDAKRKMTRSEPFRTLTPFLWRPFYRTPSLAATEYGRHRPSGLRGQWSDGARVQLRLPQSHRSIIKPLAATIWSTQTGSAAPPPASGTKAPAVWPQPPPHFTKNPLTSNTTSVCVELAQAGAS